MNYFIVESPNKVKKIQYILDSNKNEIESNKNFKVISTVGHICDLDDNDISIKFDTNKNKVTPFYKNKMKKSFYSFYMYINKLKMPQNIFIATDPDREGEAIGGHIMRLFGNTHNYIRVKYNSITKKDIIDGLNDAIKNKTSVDQNLFNSQITRRILDRCVGWMISPLCQKYIKSPSAGRVQSAVLKIIYERCLEIQSFVPENYYQVYGFFDKNENEKYSLILNHTNLLSIDKNCNTSIEESYNSSETTSNTQKKIIDTFIGELNTIPNKITNLNNNYCIFLKKLIGQPFDYNVYNEYKKNYPPRPYKTTTIQMDFYNTFKWNASKTMSILQKLFEQGHITYHRTESDYINTSAIYDIHKYIKDNYNIELIHFGKSMNQKNNTFSHECIRPTNIFFDVNKYDSDEEKAYLLIKKRTIASQMIPSTDWIHYHICKFESKMNTLKNSKSNTIGICIFLNQTSGIQDLGYKIMYPEKFKVTIPEPNIQILQQTKYKILSKLEFKKCKTSPPPRYNTSSLIRKMEHENIGRPSSYAYILDKIQKMNLLYTKNGLFFPKDNLQKYVEFLNKHFDDDFMDIEFTRNMEYDLDKISINKLNWEKYLCSYYLKLSNQIKQIN